MAGAVIERLVNDYASTLTVAWASGASPAAGADFDVAAVVDDWGNALPATGQFRLRIEDEIVVVTRDGAAAGKLKVVTRGAEVSAAAAHASGTAIEALPTAAGMALFRGAVDPSRRAKVRSGEYLGPDATPANFSGATLNRGYTYPQWIPRDFISQSVHAEIQTATPSAFWRFGAYDDDGTGQPGDLLADWGQVDSSTSGLKAIVSALTWPELGGLVWLIGVPQGASAPIRGSSGGPAMAGLSQDLTLQGTRSGIRCNNAITGALPATWAAAGGTAGYEASTHRLLLRRS
jgi:hypothetical protein